MSAKKTLAVATALFILSAISGSALAGPAGESRGQKIYVPTYSSIYFGDRQRLINLAVTLSLRNSDSGIPVVVEKISYHDEKGRLVKEHLNVPLHLGPLESRSIFIRESDTSGGLGSSFIIEWGAKTPAHPLIAEAIMIGFAQQGISFTSRGEVLSER